MTSDFHNTHGIWQALYLEFTITYALEGNTAKYMKCLPAERFDSYRSLYLHNKQQKSNKYSVLFLLEGVCS